MTSGRCHRQSKMMGRGREGGCGTEERTCRINSRCPASINVADTRLENIQQVKSIPLFVDYFSQARKTLSELCPFDIPEDEAGTSSSATGNASSCTLPSTLATFLRHSDGRKKQKKSHSSAEKNSSRSSDRSKSRNVWIETEDFFRDLEIADIETLFEVSTLHRLPSWIKNFLIPVTSPEVTTLNQYSGRAETAVTKISNPTELETVSENTDSVKLDCNTTLNVRNVKSISTSDSSSVVWLAGCRTRKMWTSERAFKKRKLLSAETDLEKILVGSPCDENLLCEFCCRGDLMYPDLNQMIMCCACKVTVHRLCYGVRGAVDGTAWLCSWCKQKTQPISDTQQCVFCSKKGGALKPFSGENGRSATLFAHLFCALWLPELFVEDLENMEPIKYIESVKETRKLVLCSICKVKCGTCIKCCHGPCRATFHPICAREGRYKMEVWGNYGCGIVLLRAFCAKHSENIEEVKIAHLGDSDYVSQSGSPSESNQNGVEVMFSELSSEKLDDVELKEIDYEDPAGDTLLEFASNDTEQVRLNGWSEKNGSGDTLSIVLRKLIDRGNINMNDLASESGISPEILVTALAENSIGTDLESKILTCLQKQAYFVSSTRKTMSEPVTCDDRGISISDVKAHPCSVREIEKVFAIGHPFLHEEGPCTLQSSLAKCGLVIDERSKNGCIEGLAVTSTHNICCDASSEVDPKSVTEPLKGINRYYIHQCLHDKLMEVENTLNSGCNDFHVQGTSRDNSCVKSSSDASVCCNHSDGESNCREIGSDNGGVVEHTTEAKRHRILQMAPASSVDGELLYFQNKLLEITMTRKLIADNLVSEVAKTLPLEVDVTRTRRWDSVLVNQYLSNLREAKKQFRKERKHKEAQAVLAAATAAAAASGRNTSLRKESLEEPAHQEKYSTYSGRIGASSQMLSRPKDSQSRVIVSRGSNEKYHDILQLGSDLSKENPRSCDVCRRFETILNPILVCSNCKVSVHLDCYRSVNESTGPWLCEVCEELVSLKSASHASSNFWEKPYFVAECCICGGTTGAFRKTLNTQWVHAFCAEWVLESTFRRGQVNPVEVMDTSSKVVDTCSICHRKYGICIKCGYGHCQTTFHPWCARSTGFYMNVKIIGGKYQHKGYCEKHSMEQRLKAESQKHGTDDLKNMKQIRVELERLRLLCERIVKREKIKRDLVVCAHGILACKRDQVARSLLARSPFFPPEVSSDSVTTSLKGNTEGYRSVNDAIQRSDDVTVDSNVSIRPRVKATLSVETDQRTDDSSTSQNLGPQKPVERPQCAGKKVPLRLSPGPQTLLDDGEWSSGLRKIFEKELVMTSDQASRKNRQLPKGYIYVPVNCLEKQTNNEHSSGGPSNPDG